MKSIVEVTSLLEKERMESAFLAGSKCAQAKKQPTTSKSCTSAGITVSVLSIPRDPSKPSSLTDPSVQQPAPVLKLRIRKEKIGTREVAGMETGAGMGRSNTVEDRSETMRGSKRNGGISEGPQLLKVAGRTVGRVIGTLRK